MRTDRWQIIVNRSRITNFNNACINRYVVCYLLLCHLFACLMF